jgi:RNA polymerase sigma-70 factor, ECF subfamily
VPRIAGTANPEAAVMKSLYDEHAADLWRHATRLTGDASAAEDVVQETLLRARQHPDAVADPSGRRGRGGPLRRAT